MSISPQSLARTRDKRSLKMPARFDDFSEPTAKLLAQSCSTRKRPKGLSLMVKQQNGTPSQQGNGSANGKNTTTNITDLESTPKGTSSIATSEGGAQKQPQQQQQQSRGSQNQNQQPKKQPTPPSESKPTVTKQQPPPQQPQQSMTKNLTHLSSSTNLTASVQYPTRLMLNEPIYLPRSVDTIAPITATLAQIANQARKPPFISRKAEVCLAYQEERKFNFIASNHAALVKIASYLGIKDRLNLRCVNRTWKSIIDSDATWKKVLVTSTENDMLWEPIQREYLKRFKLTDIFFDEYCPTSGDVKPAKLGDFLLETTPSLQRVWIRSVSPIQNSVAYEILTSFKRAAFGLPTAFSNHGRLHWRVKVAIDSQGIAVVDRFNTDLTKGDDPTLPIQEDLYDMGKWLNRVERYGKVTYKPPKFEIKPI